MKPHLKIAFENLHLKASDLLGELGTLPMSTFSDGLAHRFYEVRRALELSHKAILELDEDELKARREAKAAK